MVWSLVREKGWVGFLAFPEGQLYIVRHFDQLAARSATDSTFQAEQNKLRISRNVEWTLFRLCHVAVMTYSGITLCPYGLAPQFNRFLFQTQPLH